MIHKNLHIACGKVYATNYLNIDRSPRGVSFNLDENIIYELPEKSGVYVMRTNILNGLPGSSNSIDNIYHSHFLEHLPKIKGIDFLNNCFSSLKSKGKMRVVVPDFNLWTNKYVTGDSEFFNWYASNFCKKNSQLTHLEIFNQMLYTDHYCMYDSETLKKCLTQIGFCNVQEKTWGDTSFIPSIEELENVDSKRKPESLIIECEKP